MHAFLCYYKIIPIYMHDERLTKIFRIRNIHLKDLFYSKH
jgi:hypothetical protein